INTSFTTLVALTALFFFGGSLTQNFALVLIAGVIAGTYSSICIASPLLVTYADYIANKKVPSEK
ncbi:protein translocase subunit SecF, partial [Candidatus Kaiserbacteria bacterium]|nr:protein translocase subunit SecF [Candidatus Kaiserbacteria bacterium]